VLIVSDLSCERDQRLLFDQLSFQLNKGEVLQIKGPNGAGKTTLLRILCGLYDEFEGKVNWQLEQHPLYLGHKPGVKDLLTTAENLRWLCGLHDMKVTADKLASGLSEVGLKGYDDIPCGHLSEGQRKRVNLARFYLLDAMVWLLDEPFSAIDVEGVTRFEALMSRHVADGGAIIIISHQIIDVEADVRVLDLAC
jgi:heme exporter protein A